MKQLLLSILALVVCTSVSFAQGVTDSDVATVDLEVVSGISITNNNGLDFGNISQGQGTVTLSRSGALSSSTGITSVTAGQAGKFSVSGFPGSQFSISATSNNLTGPGSAITFSPTLFGSSTDNPSSATQGVTSGTMTGGAYYIFVGGQVTVPDGQTTGTYQGDVTVTVTYTSI